MKTWIIILISLLPTLGNANEATNDGRSKNLKFEGEVLEGMNKAPTNTVENLEQTKKRDTSHLYKKKQSFQAESRDLIRNMGMLPW